MEALKQENEEAPIYDSDAVLTVALDICESLLENGAEIHRIEDTAERICRAYGAEKVEIFGMTSLIVATITMRDGKDYTQARRVYGSSNDLSKVEKLNALSRKICRDTPDPGRVKSEISDIREHKTYSAYFRLSGGFLGAFGFALFFGGAILDALAAGLIGIFVCFIDSRRPKYLNAIAHTVLVSAIAALTIALFCRALSPVMEIHATVVNIAVIMLLIPGLALGNAIRDLLCGEVISGAVRMLQSILIAAAIAAGFTLILAIFGGGDPFAAKELSPVAMILYGGIGTLGFSILFGVSYKKLVYAVLCGMLCWSSYMLCESLLPADAHFTVLIASAAGGAACTFYAEVMARVLKTPTTVFLIPGLIPLVPGRALYYTMAYLVRQDYEMASQKGSETLYTCLGISVGIVFVSVVFQVVKNWLSAFIEKRRIKRKNGGRRGMRID